MMLITGLPTFDDPYMRFQINLLLRQVALHLKTKFICKSILLSVNAFEVIASKILVIPLMKMHLLMRSFIVISNDDIYYSLL